MFLMKKYCLGCKSLAKNRCLFPFTSNNETHYHCGKGINGSKSFQCATQLEDDSLEAKKLEECDMESCV